MLFESIAGKYHRGKHVEGQWVFGGVERREDGEPGQCFLIPVAKRDNATLISLIKQWVAPGSIIYTDCWSGYNNLKYYTICNVLYIILYISVKF